MSIKIIPFQTDLRRLELRALLTGLRWLRAKAADENEPYRRGFAIMAVKDADKFRALWPLRGHDDASGQARP